MATHTHDKLFTVVEAAERLRKKGRASLDVMRCKGQGPEYIKCGGKILYRESALEAYLAKHTIDPEKSARCPKADTAAPLERPQDPTAAEPDFSNMRRGTPKA